MRTSASSTMGDGGTFDDQRQLVRALQAPPCLCGGLNKLEDHELRRLLGQRALGPHGSMPDGGEDALDWVARS